MSILVERLIYPLYELGTGRRILAKWRELEKTPWLLRDEVRQLQWRRLKQLLDHTYAHVPFYRQRFDTAQVTPSDIRTPADMARLPPLTKRSCLPCKIEPGTTKPGLPSSAGPMCSR